MLTRQQVQETQARAAAMLERLNIALTPEELLGYVYAVLHSRAYRARHAAALRTDFPRVPLVADARQFRHLAAVGRELVAAAIAPTRTCPGCCC